VAAAKCSPISFQRNRVSAVTIDSAPFTASSGAGSSRDYLRHHIAHAMVETTNLRAEASRPIGELAAGRPPMNDGRCLPLGD
jgi:hypothetical protein